MSLQDDVKKITHDYVRKGGKLNRRKQAKRMLALAEHAEKNGCNSLGRMGRKHIVAFYMSHRDLSDDVIYQHWLAFRKLWKLAGKAGEPPKPKYKNT